MVQNETKKRVVEQNIGSTSMEDYMATKLVEIEEKRLDLLTADNIIKGYKQLNVRHKNIIDSQRLELKTNEYNKMLEAVQQ